jgi:zinc protease
VSFSIQAKRDTLPAVLEILRQVLREPLLPADQFEVLKLGRVANLEQTLTEPASLAPRLLQRELNPYPKEDIRYVPTIEESIARLRNATHDQIAKLHREYLSSQAGELTIIGDFDTNACLAVLRDTLRDWKAPQAYARIESPLEGEIPGARHTINTPDKENATYNAGVLFPLRDDDPDYPALLMGNYVLGSGTLASRLGVRVRQKEGLSYGISSSLSVSSFDRRGGMTITAICAPQNMSRLEQCVQEELDRLLRDGVTNEELNQAKNGWLQSQKVGRASDGALVGMLSNLRYLDRSMTWQAELERKVEALTPDQVLAALRKNIDPKKLVIVAAGDFGAKAGSSGQ